MIKSNIISTSCIFSALVYFVLFVDAARVADKGIHKVRAGCKSSVTLYFPEIEMDLIKLPEPMVFSSLDSDTMR